MDTQKIAKQPVKTVEKTDDIKKTNDYLPNNATDNHITTMQKTTLKTDL